MSHYNWLDPHRSHKETINSWKRLLLDHDERNAVSTLKRTDLVAIDALADNTEDTFEGGVKSSRTSLTQRKHDNSLSTSVDKLQKSKRRKANYKTSDTSASRWEQSSEGKRERDINVHGDDNIALQHPKDHSLELAPSIDSVESINVTEETQEITELKLAIASLRTKLEMLQPEGMRPSDIAAMSTAKLSVQNSSDGPASEDTTNSGEDRDNEVLLSQDVPSQRSILIWDEIRALVEACASSRSGMKSIADSAIIELGIDNLEDGVLHRLCTNEVFTQDQGDECEPRFEGTLEADTSTADLALSLKSMPSRLFLDALLHAGKAHGRAVVDSVLLPVIHDCTTFSKLASELVQKVLKEQASASMVHFLSCAFEPTPAGQTTSETIAYSALDRLPVLFHSEIHLATVQSILGYSNVPCPLPTRLWTRFNTILDLLWEQVVGFVTSTSPSALTGQGISGPASTTLKEAVDTKNETTWILRMYCPPNIWELVAKYAESGMAGNGSAARSSIEELNLGGQVRLSNPKLIQLLMTWTMRQGPMCSDLESLQRMRQFCATKLEAKQAKGLVAKLDMFIKKKGLSK
ncbi:hypothetical protein BGZ80_006304 [Entomortierella chlamydospora]|uniref:Uncharacterized protein n=1 Tax=Entomortierella chlamydospora TaxID=101097 RepID=A0A9P6MZM1_9FUNG|nr:hypothetical protein BGZ80_006304 [Entomortierella chlamydospora]